LRAEAVCGKHKSAPDYKFGVDYLRADWAVVEETLWHHRIFPSCFANLALVEGQGAEVSLCLGAGAAELRAFEGEAEVWASYAAVREETSAEVEEYTVYRHPVVALADTSRQSVRRVGRCYSKQTLVKVMGLPPLILLLVVKTGSTRGLNMVNCCHTVVAVGPKNCSDCIAVGHSRPSPPGPEDPRVR
jgi:hypothetical protein